MKKLWQQFTRYLHIYKMILIQDIKTKKVFRIDFIISFFSGIILGFANFIAIWVLFQNISSIMKWNYQEMLFLYGFSLLSQTPSSVFFDNSWLLCEKIIKGDFIIYCFRPINIFFYYTFERINLNDIGQFFLGLVLIVYSWIKLKLSLTFLSYLKLFFLLVVSSLFMVSITVLVSAMSFWVFNAKGLRDFFLKFKDYSKYPFTAFGTVLKTIFSFIIPIAFIAYYPSLFFVHKEDLSWTSFFGIFYGIGLFYCSYKIWMKGAKQYSGTGT